jgi:hypothetical protein
MAPTQLKIAHTVRPFVPFRIRMVDGSHFDVGHPEMLALHGGGRLAFVFHGGEEAGSILDVMLISELEYDRGDLPPVAPPPPRPVSPQQTPAPRGAT